jgi:hypothetical protein
MANDVVLLYIELARIMSAYTIAKKMEGPEGLGRKTLRK